MTIKRCMGEMNFAHMNFSRDDISHVASAHSAQSLILLHWNKVRKKKSGKI